MNIVTYPNDILRAKAVPVAEVTEELRHLGFEMLYIMKTGGGMGLAAPQIGRNESLLVIDTTNADKQFGSCNIMFNPKIVWRDSEKFPYVEACLSFPNITRSLANRSAVVMVKFMDEYGNTKTKSFFGLTAVCVQHEVDHLNGILFVDHKESKK